LEYSDKEFKLIQEPAWQALDRYGQLKLRFSAHHLTSTFWNCMHQLCHRSNLTSYRNWWQIV